MNNVGIEKQVRKAYSACSKRILIQRYKLM